VHPHNQVRMGEYWKIHIHLKISGQSGDAP